jgi:hypothetical protein
MRLPMPLELPPRDQPKLLQLLTIIFQVIERFPLLY